ncbi:MAG: hypothetical protein AB7K24_11970 [Gemmataceae bacterium]
MTILGKILAFLNVIAAATLVYFAALDLGKRQSWQYSVFRHELVLDGLPIDDQVIDPFLNDRTVDRMSDAMLQKMFATVGGQPVTTQQEEVSKLREQLRGELNGLDDQARRARLRDIFLALAVTSKDRYAIRERFEDNAVTTADLMKDFDSLFADLGKPEIVVEASVNQQPSAAKASDIAKRLLPKDKREAITHLLFALSSNPDRVQVVVGIKSLVAELEMQADALHVLTQQQEYALMGDRVDFEIQYNRLLAEIANLANATEDRIYVRGNHERLKAQHDDLLAKRVALVKEVEGKLEITRQDLKKLLAAQAEEERVLFEAHRVLGGIRTENERLEKYIRRLEKVK